MNKRVELIEQIKSGREELDGLLNQLSDEKMLVAALPGNWSIKDLLAHFEWWAKRAANLYRFLSRGQTPPDEDIEIDQLNARVYAENQNRSLDNVRREEREAYQALLALATEAPEADLFEPHRFAWTQGNPFVNWIINNSYSHFAEHLGDVQAWLKANQ
ncbi:MAG TPA: ClbS/DfsB family four-helix bundle protein [Anaerolineae bacterium]|nr:ClbS/DfsB family four-helix bundle protein [Anaerolineae bacterium]